jgi:iron complex outermembrane receptor protein
VRLVILLTLLAQGAHAQETADSEIELFRLEEGLRRLEQVSLPAKHPQPLREAAASVSVITAEDLEIYGWRDFIEAIGSLAGIYTTQPGDYTYIGVRGIERKGDPNTRVLILVDGHMQQELWSYSVTPEQIGLDAAMIDRIEVMRGASSSLYGSLGFLAVFNVITKRGDPQRWGKLTFDMEHARSFRGVASVGHQFKNGLELGLSLQANRGLGASYTYPERSSLPDCIPDLPRTCTNVSTPESDAVTGVSLFGHLEYQGLQLHVSYQWWDKHIPFAPYRTLFNDPVNHYLLERAYLDASYQVGRPSLIQAQVRGRFDWSGYTDDLAYSSDGTAAGHFLFHDEAHPYWLGADARLFLEREWPNQLRFAFTAGGEFTAFYGEELSGPVGGPTVFPHSWLFFGATYGQAELSYLRKLFLTVGLRGDFADRFNNEVSPRASLVIHPYESGAIKLLYAHGFVHPAWYEAFFDDKISILANTALRPERVDHYELVLEQDIAPVTLTGSVFFLRARDLIEAVYVCVPATELAPATPDCPADMASRVQRQNVREIDSLGSEIGLKAKLRIGTRLFANYSYARARNGDGSRAFDSPEHMFKLGVSQPLWREHLLIGVEARYMSGRRASIDDTSMTSGVMLLSAHVTWRGLPAGLSAALKVYNLVGTTWYEPSTAEDSFPITRAPHTGPTVTLRLSYER